MQPEMRAVDHSDTSVGDAASAPASPPWNAATKIAFRFAFVYFSLYNLYIPLYLLAFPPFSQILALYNSACALSVRFVSAHVLHLSHDFATDYLNTPARSKDTTFEYVEVLVFFAVALLATVIWSLLDRRRLNYEWLHRWFLVYLRLCLACAMIAYGAIKISPHQFPPPTLSKLLGTYGDSSPTNLLWTFMGASRSYSVFGGVTELAAGMLLVVPRLATVGALMAAADMTNVLMLNLGYDVPVKLASIHLILIAIIIFLPDLLRLVDFFVLNRTARLAPAKPLVRRVWLNRAFVALQIAFGVVLLTHDLYHGNRLTTQKQAEKNTPLYGIWSVDDFNLDAQPRPPLLNDSLRWQRLIVESQEDAVIQGMTGSLQYLHVHSNSPRNGFSLTRVDDPGWIAEFSYDNSPPGSLFLTGKVQRQPVTIKLHREDESKLPLNSQGFHWVQDAQ